MHVCMYACMHACMYVCMYVCIKIAWIKGMIESNMNNWMAIPLHYLRHVCGTLVFECDYDISMVDISGLPPFYYEGLVANSNVRKTDIILWNNKAITIAGRSVYYHNWHQVGIKRIKMKTTSFYLITCFVKKST